VHHKVAVRRAREAVRRLWYLVKALGWYVPKFLLWTLSGWLLRLVKNRAVWCWKHRRAFGPWCKRKIGEFPGKARNAVVGFAEFITQPLPRWCNRFVRYCLSLLTVRIPATLKAFLNWLRNGMKTISTALSAAAHRLTSFLHTPHGRAVLLPQLNPQEVSGTASAMSYTLFSWMFQSGYGPG